MASVQGLAAFHDWFLSSHVFLTLHQILGLPKLKAFADKSDVTQNIKVVFHRIENSVGKEEKAGYRKIFFFSHNVFKRLFSPVRQVVIVWLWVNPISNDSFWAQTKLKAFADDK